MRHSTDYLPEQASNLTSYHLEAPLQIPQPDLAAVDLMTFPPHPSNINTFFLSKLFEIKHALVKNAAKQTVVKIYESINGLLAFVASSKRTFSDIQHSRYIYDIALLLDELDIFKHNGKRAKDLEIICETGFKKIQELLQELYPHSKPLESKDWSNPKHTHLQELMFTVEDNVSNFLDNLDHPNLQSFQELLEFSNFDLFTNQQSYLIKQNQQLYAAYHNVRASLLLLIQILEKVKTNTLIDHSNTKVLRDDTDVFYTSYLYPLLQSAITPRSIQSQTHNRVHSNVLNPEPK